MHLKINVVKLFIDGMHIDEVDIKRILANLNVLRCVRKFERKGWSVSGYQDAIQNIEHLVRTKPHRQVTMCDLTTPPVAGVRIMSHLLTIVATKDDLPDVKRALQDGGDEESVVIYRAAYAAAHTKPTPVPRWSWFRWLSMNTRGDTS